jgi:hypothetical protein
MPSKKVLHGLNLGTNKIENLGAPTSANDAATKEFVETYVNNRTDVIYKTVTENFNNSNNIQTNTNCTVTNGIIRPTFFNYNGNGSNINLAQTSNGVSVVNGAVSVVSGSVGYDSTTDTYFSDNYTTQPFALQNATKIRVTPTFTTPTGITGFTSSDKVVDITTTGTNEHLVTGFLDPTTSKMSYATMEVNNFASPTLQYHYWSASTSSYTSISIAYNGVSLGSALSDAHIRNLSSSVDVANTLAYIAYPSGAAEYRVKKINLNNPSQTYDELVIGITNGTSAQKIDTEIANNRLHVIGCFGTTSTRSVHYFYKTLSSWGASPDGNAFMTQYNVTTFTPYTAKFAIASGTKLGWAAFARNGTASNNLLHFGIVDTTATGGSYQWRTGTSTGTTPSCNTGVVSHGSFSSSGNGTIAYDNVNDRFLIVWANNAQSALHATWYPANNQSTLLGSNNSTLSSFPLNNLSNRDMDMLIVPSTNTTRRYELVMSNNIRTDAYRVEIEQAGGGGISATGSYTALFDSSTTNTLGTIKTIQTSASPFTYAIVKRVGNGLNLQEYRTNIQPILRARIVNSNGVSIGGTSTYQIYNSTGTTVSFSSAQTAAALQFEFYYPILKSSWDSATNPKPYSVTLNSYLLEQIEPAVSATPNNFTSKSLLNNELIRNITLNVQQTLNGHSVDWYVSSNGGSNWTQIGISNVWQVTIPEAQQGTDLRVKAQFNYSGVTSVEQLPFVDSYNVLVPNVVTTSDVYTVQTNMIKMGLQLQALTTISTTNFTKMYIDTFNYSNQALFDANNTFYTPSQPETFKWNQIGHSIRVQPGCTLTSNVITVETEVEELFVYFEPNDTGVQIDVSRDGGLTWYTNVKNNSIVYMNRNTDSAKNQLQIKATFNSYLFFYGWAYLYA